MTDSFGARKTLGVRSIDYQIYRLDAVKGAVDTLPYTLKILLENLLRFEDGENITAADITALANWDPAAEPDREISFTPARVVLQDRRLALASAHCHGRAYNCDCTGNNRINHACMRRPVEASGSRFQVCTPSLHCSSPSISRTCQA